MITIPPVKYPRRPRQRLRPRLAPARPGALVLTAAIYEEGDWVRLAFDRAIDVAELDGSQIIVNDPVLTGQRFDASGIVTIIDPQTVQLALIPNEVASGSDLRLTASAATGIVAVAPPLGGTWGGVSELEMPFP